MKKSKEARINLLRYKHDEAREKKANIQFFLISGIVFLLFLTTIGGIWWFQGQKLQVIEADNRILQEEIEQLTRIMVSADTSELVDASDLRQVIITALEQEVHAKAKHFGEIYLLSIPGITIGKMDLKSNNDLSMTAYCNSQAKFINFLDEVRNLDYVQEVKNISTKYNDKTGEINFNLTLVWGEVE